MLSGYYGFGNSGDEAVLQSILLALEEQGSRAGVRIEPTVLSSRPDTTRRMYGVHAVHRMRPADVFEAVRGSDGLISGGGSLLQDATGIKTIPYYLAVLKLAQWLGKPTFIYSQGVGPVRRRLFYPWIAHVFNRCEYISVRDAESAALLAEMGVADERVSVVPDPVMGLPLKEGDGGEKGAAREGRTPVVGVSVRYWNKDRSDLRLVAECLDYLLAQNGGTLDMRFLPFHLPSDEQASAEVIGQMKLANKRNTTIVRGVEEPQEMLAQVRECDLLIGMRLHSLIYAASQYVPLAGISYDPKIDQFLNRLDMQAVGSTARLHPYTLAAECMLLLKHAGEWAEEKQSLIEELKQKSQEPAKQISSFIRNKG